MLANILTAALGLGVVLPGATFAGFRAQARVARVNARSPR